MDGAAGMAATESGMATAEAGVSAAETRVAAATAVTSSAMLRPNGHSEKESERRDGHQATHTDAIISPFSKNGSSFTNGAQRAGKRAGGRI